MEWMVDRPGPNRIADGGIDDLPFLRASQQDSRPRRAIELMSIDCVLRRRQRGLRVERDRLGALDLLVFDVREEGGGRRRLRDEFGLVDVCWWLTSDLDR